MTSNRQGSRPLAHISYQELQRLLEEAGCTESQRWKEFMDSQISGVFFDEEGSIERLRQLRNFIYHSSNDVSREQAEIRALYNEFVKQTNTASSVTARLHAIDAALAAIGASLSSNRPRGRIIRPPGVRLNAIAEFVFSKKTYERVLQPTIADMQEEYISAVAHDKKWKARIVRLRGYVSFMLAVLTQLPVSWSRLIVRIWTAAGN